MSNLRLPNPPEVYLREWASQYTRTLEAENQYLWTAVQTLQTFQLPNYTTTQKNLLTNRAGLLVFDTTLGKACINTGSAWQTITSV